MEIETALTAIQSAALVITFLIMYHQYRRTIRVMQNQLDELKLNVQVSTHADLLDKILKIYDTMIDHTDDLKDTFSANSNRSAQEVKKRYFVFAMLDVLYLMYLNRDAAHPGIHALRDAWIANLYNEPNLKRIYDDVRHEYDLDYTKFMDDRYASLHKSGGERG